MFRRKLAEIGSALYRTILYPFVRMHLENRSRSILKQGSYLHGKSTLCGRNYVGKNTLLNHTVLGFGSYISDRGDLTDTVVGKYTSIGTDVSTCLGDHPLDSHVALHPAFYSTGKELGFTYTEKDTFREITYLDEKEQIQVEIGSDVWIGNNVKILSGVTIGDGAVVGCGSVVTKDLEPYGIYAGVPAKMIRKRYSEDIIEKLLKNPWWEKDEAWINSHINQFADVEEFLKELGRSHK